MPFKIKTPTKQELVRLRAYSEEKFREEMPLMQGWSGEDEGGLYFYEKKTVEMNGNDIQESKGKKVYLENYYQELETLILKYYKEAHHINQTKSEGMLKTLELFSVDAVLNVLMLQLKDLMGHPFLSSSQIYQMIREEGNLQAFFRDMAEIDLDFFETPLGTGALVRQEMKKDSSVCMGSHKPTQSIYSLNEFASVTRLLN